MNKSIRHVAFLLSFLFLLGGASARAQSTGTIRGSVADAGGGRIPKAEMTARQVSTNYERKTQTDDAGLYLFSALPLGTYRVEARSAGFRTTVKDGIVLDINNILEVDFSLQVGQVAETVVVEAGGVGVETNTMSVGHVVNQFTVQELPLNGRHFVDLALVAPGSVVPPTNGFLTAPLRGQGSFGVVTAGNREDTVNFQINGINLNDIVQNQITFQPSINTVQEFKLLNSVYSAEYGHTSGSVVNIATRSGTNDIHGELFEFFRNDALDAKNFFDNPTLPIPPFKRNQFGGAVGGPIWIPHIYDGRNKTFWFFSFEGLRQRQAVTFSRQVLNAAQRASVTDPVSLKLLPLIPPANVPGTSNFSGTGSAPVNINQWTLDISHEFSSRDRLHGYYAHQRDLRQEPAAPVSASTLPGFGDIRKGHRQVFTLNEWHTFGNNVVNEFRFGLNRILISFNGANTSDPATFGFTGLPSFGMPEIVIQETGLDFGGVAGFPQGRGDMTLVWADSLSWLTGKHTFRVGTELRRSYNNNLNNDTGQFTFSTIANFAAGKPSQFVFTQGGTSSAIGTGAVQFFAQDNYKWMSNLTLELGFRYEMNTTPTERFNRFVEFDPGTGSLRRLGSTG
ncbi:MAG: carboxypeptidase-like regulatory domain-containing protein, partial [Candidatus Acidiferrales bacterium]